MSEPAPISDLRKKRDELDTLIATARVERDAINRQINKALYKASAAAQRLERLNKYGKPIENPPHPAIKERDE